MKQVTLQFNFDDDYDLNNIEMLSNTTDFESDSKLFLYVCIAGIKAYELNKDNFSLQDELRKLGITIQND